MWAYFMIISFLWFNRIISITPLTKVIAIAIIINIYTVEIFWWKKSNPLNNGQNQLIKQNNQWGNARLIVSQE